MFLPDGALLFVSAPARPGDGKDGDEPVPALWLLPADGGEARVIAARPGGVGGLAVARDAGTVVVAVGHLPVREGTAEDDAERRKARKDRKVSAILHSGYPVRYWDHDLGPDRRGCWSRRRALRSPASTLPAPRAQGPRIAPSAGAPGQAPRAARPHRPRPAPSSDSAWTCPPDGATLVADLERAGAGAAERSTLVAIDTATGDRARYSWTTRTHEDGDPAVSPDGRRVASRSRPSSSPDRAAATAGSWCSTTARRGHRLASGLGPLARPTRRLAARTAAPCWSRPTTTAAARCSC